jgi:hypothetical protein
MLDAKRIAQIQAWADHDDCNAEWSLAANDLIKHIAAVESERDALRAFAQDVTIALPSALMEMKMARYGLIRDVRTRGSGGYLVLAWEKTPLLTGKGPVDK